MTQSPEIDQQGPQEQVGQSDQIQERPDQIELSPAAQSTGAQATDDKFTSQVSDDDGQVIVQPTDGDDTPAITIPNNQTTLKSQSKGDPSQGSTWNAKFLLRFVKKAMQLGKKVIFGNS